MDLLSKRYANPCFFLDGVISTGRFSCFVVDLINADYKEKEEKIKWDVYLHKVHEMSYAEYEEEIENNKNNRKMTERTIETTIQHSMNILNNFNPEENEQQGGET
jgi:hypothetical protein